jgi:hypothetical protein
MSTKVDNLGALGWKPQQPYVISGADYKLGPAYTGNIGVPVELDTALGTSGVDTNDQNKRWVKPYASTTSATQSLGIMFKHLAAKGNANDRRLGLGGYRRDLALLQFGIAPILNVGSTTVTMYDRVAPLYNATDSLSGFGAWSEGKKILGYCFQAEIPAGHYGWIFITVETSPANSTALADLSDVTITAAAEGDFMYHNGTAWVDLALGKMTLSGAADGDILYYNTDHWEDVALSLSLVSDLTIGTDAKGDAIMRNAADDAYINARLYTELLATPVTTGDNHVFTSTKTPLAVVSVFQSAATQTAAVQYLYDATATVPTLKYNTSTKAFNTNKATDADTHILVTYWGDPAEA